MASSDRKSVIASGLLSFFLGPLGWLYAAPLKSALLGGGAWLLCAAILPEFLLYYIAYAVCPVSAVAGMLYALGYNRTGQRIPLLGKDEPKRLTS